MSEILNREEMRMLQIASLQLASNGIVITNAEGVIQWVNNGFTKLTGYSLEEVVGHSTRILMSGKQDSSYYDTLWSTISSGKVWSGELINRRKDGSTYFEEMSITPILDKKGEIANYIAIKRDITVRKTAEEALLQNLRKLEDQIQTVERARSVTRAILDAASEAFFLLSVGETVLWVNRAFERFFALKEEDVFGSKLEELIPHFEHVFTDAFEIQMYLQEIKKSDNVTSRVTVSQQWPLKRELEIYSTPVLKTDGEDIGMLFVFRDVTREREVERLKSDFVSLISHELRTPLTSVLGYIDLLLEEDEGNLQKEHIEYLQVAKRNTEQLTKLVSDLLTVSRIEAGALKLKWETIDLKKVINEVVDKLRPLFELKQQLLTLNLDNKRLIVEGDTERISMVLTNLLSNAHKYTPIGGKINVKTQTKGKRIQIDVADTGIGLSVEDQKKLFTKFFRSRDSEAQNISGAGLGLWISKALVEMHGGDITATSVLGKGSTFTVRLPLEQNSPPRV